MIIANVVPQYPFNDLISFASELYDSDLSLPSWFVVAVHRSQSFCSLFLCMKSLIFSWIALSGFQSTGIIFLLYAPNFFLDCPLGFPIHRDAPFFLSRLFRVRAQRSSYTQYFLTAFEFAGCGSFSPSIIVRMRPPLEIVVFTTYIPSQLGVHLPRSEVA